MTGKLTLRCRSRVNWEMTPQLLLSMLNDDADNDDGAAADYNCDDNAGYGDVIDNCANMIIKDAY